MTALKAVGAVVGALAVTLVAVAALAAWTVCEIARHEDD